MSRPPESTPSGATEATARPHIPDHELIRIVGRGGYGEVWLARSTTGSYRAVKVVYRTTFSDDTPYDREFRGIKEFEPISRSHPAQVDILHVGKDREDAYFYYVMELADDATAADGEGNDDEPTEVISAKRGTRRRTPTNPRASTDRDSQTASSASSGSRPIDPKTYQPKTLRGELRQKGRLPVAECLRLGASLAEALGHLHENGLVHRDIKPSNVIFVNGVPKLADIGLVAPSDATLSFVGTEGYLPPEGPGKTQADLFGLGKVLYEMATGNDRTAFPEPPPDLVQFEDHKAFLELNEVVLKACEESVELRYQESTELAADLRDILAGRSVRRKHAMARLLATSLRVTAVLVLLGFVAFLAWRAYGPKWTGPETLPLTQAVEVPLAIPEDELRVHFANRFHDISPDGERLIYVNQGKLYLYQNDHAQPLFEGPGQQWFYWKLPTWSPDGERIAVVAVPKKSNGDPDSASDRTLLTGRLDGESFKVTSELRSQRVRGLQWWPDGAGLTVHSHRPLGWFDVKLGEGMREWPEMEAVGLRAKGMAYSPDGKWLCAHDGDDLWLLPAGGGEAVRLTSDIYREIHPTWEDSETIIYVAGGVVGSESQSSRLTRLRINQETGAPVGEPLPMTDYYWSELLHPRVVAGGSRLMVFEKTRIGWMMSADYPNASDVQRLGRGEAPVLSPDGKLIYYIDRTPGREGIYSRPTKAGAEARFLASARGIGDHHFDISPDGAILSIDRSGSNWGQVELLDTVSGEARTIYREDGAGAILSRWSPKEQIIAFATYPKNLLYLVDGLSGAVRRTIEMPGHHENSLEWSPSGDKIALVLNNRIDENRTNYRIEVYSLKDETWTVALEGDSYIEAMQWFPDARSNRIDVYGYFAGGHHQSLFLDTGKIKALLPSDPIRQNDWLGKWAPDGAAFYFMCLVDPFRMDVFRPAANEVVHQSKVANIPRWSDDGNMFAWVKNENRMVLTAYDLKP